MGVIATAIRHMFKAGIKPEDIVAAVEEMEAESAPKRTARQDRNRRYYEKKASEKRLKASETSYSDESVLNKTPSRGGARVEDITSNLEISGQEENKKENARDARSPVSGFSDFWTLFPNKVGKRDAEKAFAAALRRAPFEAIMAGLRRYVAKTDDRPWCNPATFLNQNRWEDQPAPAVAQRANGPPRRENYVDAMHRIIEGRANGTENIFGTDGDVERLPAGQRQSRIDAPHLRGGIAGRFVSGGG